MDWDALVKWQDSEEQAARASLMEHGDVLPRVYFVVDGVLTPPEGLMEVAEMPGSPEVRRSLVCLVRETTPEAIIGLLDAVGDKPGELRKLGEVFGLDRKTAAKKALDVLTQRYGLTDMDVHWRAIKRLGEKLNAYAALNVTETWWKEVPEGEKRPAGEVRHMKGRREAVMLALETHSRSRVISFPINRENPDDEKSKIVSLGERMELPNFEGRVAGLVRRAS